jgi:Ni/Fe-hydrogenase subunit HybB-like protein
MTGEITNYVFEAMPHFEGYVYPNEATQQPLWSVLIVLYPYITGLVAGAFIMASLVRVFKVHALEPVYRLSMLTAFAFLLCAPLPLLFHLGHPERCLEVMMTPHLTSPMAIFGFVYAWYLMAVLLLELWFDYRRDFVEWSNRSAGWKGVLYRLFTVGFIFGSVKANPWWGNVLMPIIFIMSAMVSGIALCVFNYMVLSWIRRKNIDMRCLDVMCMFLFYTLVMDAAIEALDWIHRVYSAEEGFQVMQYMAREKLFYTLNLGQAMMGTLVPFLLLGSLQLLRRCVPEIVRRRMYFGSAVLILCGVLAMRWNVVIGGQLFSKSLRGVMSYKMEFAGMEGWFMGALLLSLPFIILTVMVKLFLSERLPSTVDVPTQKAQPDETNFGQEIHGTTLLSNPRGARSKTDIQLKT